MPLPTGLLVDIAVGLAEVAGLWREHVGDGSAHHGVRVLATESYEAWVTTWVDDGLVDVHDHGDSAGAVVVVQGALVQLDDRGRRRRTLDRGSVALLPLGAPHDMTATGAVAVAIEVFSPPLAAIGSYDGDGLRTGEEPVRPPPPVFDAPGYVRARQRHRTLSARRT